MAARRLQSDCSDARPVALETAARAALGMRAGHVLTDAEWAAARSKLLEFARILRGWDPGGVPRGAK